jgi:glycosyltransferase involved in cell wall biosynthesis
VSRRLEGRLAGLIVPSRAIERALRRYGLRIPIRIIPTGLDLAEFTGGDGQRFCRSFGLASDRPTLVYVGRVAHEKNIGVLLEVLHRVRRTVPEVLLVIAGEGPAREALQGRADQLSLSPNVVFIGCPRAGRLLRDTAQARQCGQCRHCRDRQLRKRCHARVNTSPARAGGFGFPGQQPRRSFMRPIETVGWG